MWIEPCHIWSRLLCHLLSMPNLWQLPFCPSMKHVVQLQPEKNTFFKMWVQLSVLSIQVSLGSLLCFCFITLAEVWIIWRRLNCLTPNQWIFSDYPAGEEKYLQLLIWPKLGKWQRRNTLLLFLSRIFRYLYFTPYILKTPRHWSFNAFGKVGNKNQNMKNRLIVHKEYVHIVHKEYFRVKLLIQQSTVAQHLL